MSDFYTSFTHFTAGHSVHIIGQGKPASLLL